MKEKGSRVDFVYDAVVQRLYSGELKPGDLIKRRNLAAELRTSISPVTEAMLQLEMEGLLETIPRKGTRVRQPTQRDVWGMQIVRIAIEVEAARLVCGQPVLEHRDKLGELAEIIDATPRKGGQRLNADAAFHRHLVELAGCPALLKHFDMTIRQSLLLVAVRNMPTNKVASHLELLAALETENSDEAEQAMRVHIQTGKEFYALERGHFAETVKVKFGDSPKLVSKRITRSVEQLLDR